jgi:hypothetical protein
LVKIRCGCARVKGRPDLNSCADLDPRAAGKKEPPNDLGGKVRERRKAFLEETSSRVKQTSFQGPALWLIYVAVQYIDALNDCQVNVVQKNLFISTACCAAKSFCDAVVKFPREISRRF